MSRHFESKLPDVSCDNPSSVAAAISATESHFRAVEHYYRDTFMMLCATSAHANCVRATTDAHPEDKPMVRYLTSLASRVVSEFTERLSTRMDRLSVFVARELVVVPRDDPVRVRAVFDEYARLFGKVSAVYETAWKMEASYMHLHEIALVADEAIRHARFVADSARALAQPSADGVGMNNENVSLVDLRRYRLAVEHTDGTLNMRIKNIGIGLSAAWRALEATHHDEHTRGVAHLVHFLPNTSEAYLTAARRLVSQVRAHVGANGADLFPGWP